MSQLIYYIDMVSKVLRDHTQSHPRKNRAPYCTKILSSLSQIAPYQTEPSQLS